MNQAAASLAVARRNQGIVLSFVRNKANLAIPLSFLKRVVLSGPNFGDIEDAVGLFEVVGVSESEGFDLIFGLDDHIFDSSKLNYISRFWIEI